MAQPIRHTRTSLLRHNLHHPSPPKSKSQQKLQEVARRNLHRSRSKGPPPTPPNTVQTFTNGGLDDIILSSPEYHSERSRFHRLWQEYTEYQNHSSRESPVFKAIESDIGKYLPLFYSNELSCKFFRKFIQASKEQFTIADIAEQSPLYNRKQIIQFYTQELSLRHIHELSSLGLDQNSPYILFEVALQAANNLLLVSDAIYRQFRALPPEELEKASSIKKIRYFFRCLENPFWLQTTDTLKIELHLNDEDPIGLTWIPSVLKELHLPLLKTLNLSGQDLSSLPKGLFPSSSLLSECDISNNPLRTFPEDFGRAWNLKKLDCQWTHFSSLPALLQENCPNLETLNASHNRSLTTIEGNPSHWRKLEELDLSFTSLSSFPFTLHASIKVNLSSTPIQQPASSTSEESLQEISLLQLWGTQDFLIQEAQEESKN